MNELSTNMNNPQPTPGGYPMKKSDMVIAILALRSGVAVSGKKILKDLAIALKYRSLTLAKWDREVPPGNTHRIIHQIGSVRGQLTMQAVIGDIDKLLVREGVKG
jgi:hypothetical protein